MFKNIKDVLCFPIEVSQSPAHITSTAEVTVVSAVYLCKESSVAMDQEEKDHRGRKGLRWRLSKGKQRRQEKRDGKVIPRTQKLPPTVQSRIGDGATEEEPGWGRELYILHGSYKTFLNGWVLTFVPWNVPDHSHRNFYRSTVTECISCLSGFFPTENISHAGFSKATTKPLQKSTEHTQALWEEKTLIISNHKWIIKKKSYASSKMFKC